MTEGYCVAIFCNSLHGGVFQCISLMLRDTFTRKLFRISIRHIDFGLFTSASDHDFKTFSFFLLAVLIYTAGVVKKMCLGVVR